MTDGQPSNVKTMEQTSKQPPIGGSYLKPEHLNDNVKATVPVDKRMANKNAEAPGPYAKPSDFPGGGFNLEIPVTISDVPFVVSVPDKGHDAQSLIETYGKNLNEWVGRNVVVYADPTLKKIRIRPA